MVIRGRIRGNGRKLAAYVMALGENEKISVLDIYGTSQPDSVTYSLIEMSLTSELTMSDKGLYHVQLNPKPGEDKTMTMEDWLKAAEILEKEAGYNGQKRVIVLHTKKGRTHAHCIWERYDHAKGIMISDSFNRLAQDRARKEMERVLQHQPTPDRNQNREAIKLRLTDLWRKTKSADEFIRYAADSGLQICKGTLRPFMVVDHTGTSFDLVRQLGGVKTKDVRHRLGPMPLQTDKEAIRVVRVLQNAAALEQKQDKLVSAIEQQKGKRKTKTVSTFALKLAKMKQQVSELIQGEKPTTQKQAILFSENKNEILPHISEAERKRKINEFKKQFARTRQQRSQDLDLEH